MARKRPAGKAEAAKQLARHFLVLRRVHGPVVWDEGALWLLSRPAPRPTDADRFAAAMLAEQLPGRAVLAGWLGCAEVIALDASHLARWSWALGELERQRDLHELIDEGVRPLRGYRGQDVPARLREWRRQLESYQRLLTAMPAARACLDDEGSPPDAETLGRALVVRLHTVGNWPIDPIEELARRSVPAERSLLEWTRQDSDPPVAALASRVLEHRQILRGQGPSSVPASFLALAALAGGAHPLPAVEEIPEPDGTTITRAAARLAILYGPAVGRHVLDILARPWRQVIHTAGEQRPRLEQLLLLARRVEQGAAPQVSAGEEATLTEGLKRLHHLGLGGPRELAQLFLRWMAPAVHAPGLGTRTLTRVAAAAWPRGLTAALTAVSRAWSAGWRQRDLQPPDADRTQERLAFTLSFCDLELPLPGAVSSELMKKAREHLRQLPAERAREAWTWLCRCPADQQPSPYWIGRLLASAIPIAHLERAQRLRVLDALGELINRPGRVAAYLDCLETLLKRPGGDEWNPYEIAELFSRGADWAPTLVLTLLGRAQQHEGGEQLAALAGLARDLRGGGPMAEHARALAAALEEWNAPARTPVPEGLHSLAGLLGVSEADMQAYVHHRRLAGFPAPLARAVAVPLELPAREAEEAHYLETQLATLPVDSPRRPGLVARLERLRDPVDSAGRRRHAAEQARLSLQRSLTPLREQSLEVVLDGVYRRYLTRLVGPVVPLGPLPHGLRAALSLLHAHRIDRDQLIAFLREVLTGQPLRERPANRAWLARAAAAGIDTTRWLAGFRETVEVAGGRIRLATEDDPLEVLRMGSYFRTCLSLEDGQNAASTLSNAVDVNKHVIYARRDDGTVVARKLIGATARGELAGYCTYAAEQREVLLPAIHDIVGRFAAACGLRLSNRATPESLHGLFWYNDGNEAWNQGNRGPAGLVAVPPGVPGDEQGMAEWNLDQAARQKDGAWLARIVLHGPEGWRIPALYRLYHDCPRPEDHLSAVPYDLDTQALVDVLTRQGRIDLADRLYPEGMEVDGRIRLMVDLLPWRSTIVRRSFREIEQTGRSGPAGLNFHGVQPPAPAAALGEMGELIGLLRLQTERYCPDCRAELGLHANWKHGWAQLLRVVWMRDGDARPVIRALTKADPLVVAVISTLAQRERIAGLAAPLRRLLAGAGDPDDIALALGSQGDPGDGPRLLALLEADPGNRKRCVAVIRTGHAASVERAREVWRGGEENGLGAVHLGQVREIASPWLARRLRRRVRDLLRQQADASEVGAVLERMAALGLPGPDGDPAEAGTVAGSLAGRVARWHAVWEETSRIGEIAQGLESGSPDSLTRWTHLAEQFSGLVQHRPAVHDARVERALSHLVRQGPVALREPALLALAELFGGRVIEQVVLLGLTPEPAAWPAALCDRLVGLALAVNDPQYERSGTANLLACLQGRHRLAAVSRPGTVSLTCSGSVGPSLALALGSDAAAERRAASDLVDAVAAQQPDCALELLDLAARWLPPDRAEEVLRATVGRLPLDAWVSRGPGQLVKDHFHSGKYTYRLRRHLWHGLWSRLPRHRAWLEECWAEGTEPRMDWLHEPGQEA